MKKIILVGNGPSIIGSGLGPVIDSFENVVRFNNFVTDGYEDDCGSKVTILARRSCDDVKLHSPDKFEAVVNFITYCKWSSAMMFVNNSLQDFYGSKLSTVDIKTCKEIGADIGLDQPHNEWASIGALAIGLAIRSFSTVDICGFDHLAKSQDGEVKHYFPKKTKDAKFHNGEKEKQYIEKLIMQGRVRRL